MDRDVERNERAEKPAQVRMEQAAGRIAKLDEDMASLTNERKREAEILHQAREEVLAAADKAAEIAGREADYAETGRGL